MDLDAYFAENPMGGSFPTNPDFKSGFVTLVGRPNAGKSTLLNAIMGKKIAITSNTAQTTRHRFRAVHTTDAVQMIIVDTPGLHKPQDALGEELNTSAIKALEDVDVVAMLIDASKPIGRGDEWVAAQVRAAKGSAKICVLSKTDLASDAEISAQREAAEKLCDWDAMVALSAETGRNVDAFVEEVQFLLPEGPAWFPADMETDQPIEVVVAARRSCATSSTRCPMPSAWLWRRWNSRSRTYTASTRSSTWSATARRASSSASAGQPSSASAPRPARTWSFCSARRCFWTCR